MGKFISCDWGTSSLRVRLIDESDLSILATVTTNDGIANTYENWKESGFSEERKLLFYQSVVRDKIKELEKSSNALLKGVPIIISGMASSSMGMMELPYADVPFSIHASQLIVKRVPASDVFEHAIALVSGIKSSTDIMRGEETQLLGCDIHGEQRVFILPGTHSKRVIVEFGKIISIETFMTGELLSLLSTKSILAHSVEKHDHVIESAFKEGVMKGLKSNFLKECFAVRTNHLFKKMTRPENYDFLKGVLVGAELKDLFNDKRRFTIVGTEYMNRDYFAALKLFGINEIETADSEQAAIRGHSKIL